MINNILKAFLLITFPILILIFGSTLILSKILELNPGILWGVSTFIGWSYWKYMATKWVSEMFERGHSRNEIIHIGQISLAIWNLKFYDETLANKK